MNFRTLVYCIFLTLLLLPNTFANDPTFSPKELRAEFNEYRGLIEKLHPGLYHYTKKEALDAEFDKIESELNQELTSLQFFQKLVRLNKLFANVHTKFTPPKKIWDQLKTEVPIFPLEVYWYNEKLYALKDLSESAGVPEGSEVISINGESASKLFLRFRDTIHRDGFNVSYPNRRTYTSFSIIYASQIGLSKEFDINYLANGKKQSIQLKAVSGDRQKEIRKKRYPNANVGWEAAGTMPFTLEFEDTTALLTLRTFSTPLIKKRGQNWKKFIKRAFKQIRQKKSLNLVIDVRGNSGGQTEPGFLILRYLTAKPFVPFKSITAKVAKVPGRKRFANQIAIDSFESYEWKAENGGYVPGTREDFVQIKPFKKQFKGKVFVLIDAFSNSATGTFSGQLKTHTNAVSLVKKPAGILSMLSLARHSNTNFRSVKFRQRSRWRFQSRM